MVHAVITGGVGFLGSRLARELLAAGSIAVDGGAARQLTRVTVLDQASLPADLAADERVAFTRGDLGELLDPSGRGQDTLAAADVIFHLAAAFGRPGRTLTVASRTARPRRNPLRV